MPGYYDVEDWTELSESSPRTGKIRTLQYHHSTVTNRAAARALYAAGGRVVSPNGQVHGPLIYGIVARDRRAFTSGVPAQDQQSYTLEVDNETLGPDWLIPVESKDRIAQLMVDMYRNGDLEGLFYGEGGLLEHHDVPGTYATACAGPDANSAYIIQKAKAIYAGATTQETTTMLRLVGNGSKPFIPAQPPIPGATAGAPYYLVNGDTGKYIPVYGTQAQANHLSAFIANPGTYTGYPAGSLTKTDFDWLLATLARLAALAPSTGGSAANLQPILDAIAAGEAQDVASQAQFLAAVAQVDENTLATFGLQRRVN